MKESRLIKYLDLQTGRLADSGEVENKLSVILEKKGLKHKLSVESGGKGFSRTNNRQKLKEQEARLRNLNYKVGDKPRHERKLEALKKENSRLEKEEAESVERLRLVSRELEKEEKDFNEKYVGVVVLNLEEVLKLKGGIN